MTAFETIALTPYPVPTFCEHENVGGIEWMEDDFDETNMKIFSIFEGLCDDCGERVSTRANEHGELLFAWEVSK